jgi:hypothetical protein
VSGIIHSPLSMITSVVRSLKSMFWSSDIGPFHRSLAGLTECIPGANFKI